MSDDNAGYDLVYGWIGWDIDGKLRLAEDTEWDSEDGRGFRWQGEPKSICLKMPRSAHPSAQKKEKITQVITLEVSAW